MYTVVVYTKGVTPSDNDVGCGLEHGIHHAIHDVCREPMRVPNRVELRWWRCQNLIWTSSFYFVRVRWTHSIHLFLPKVEHLGEMDPVERHTRV